LEGVQEEKLSNMRFICYTDFDASLFAWKISGFFC